MDVQFANINSVCNILYNFNIFFIEPADMDECSVFEGQLCSHICINTIGSYRCDCPRGLTLAQDQSTCIEQG